MPLLRETADARNRTMRRKEGMGDGDEGLTESATVDEVGCGVPSPTPLQGPSTAPNDLMVTYCDDSLNAGLMCVQWIRSSLFPFFSLPAHKRSSELTPVPIPIRPRMSSAPPLDVAQLSAEERRALRKKGEAAVRALSSSSPPPVDPGLTTALLFRCRLSKSSHFSSIFPIHIGGNPTEGAKGRLNVPHPPHPLQYSCSPFWPRILRKFGFESFPK